MEATVLRAPSLAHHERAFDAWCIAPCLDVPNWSMFDLHGTDGCARNPHLASAIGEALAARTVHLAFGPSTAAMCGTVVEQERFTDAVRLPNGIALLRNRRVPSEGTWLERAGEAVTLSSAGELLLVAEGGGRLLVANAGLASLVDSVLVDTGVPSRPHESVVFAIADAFRGHRVPLEHVSLSVLFSIPPEHCRFSLDIGPFAEFHKKLYAYGTDRWGGEPFHDRKVGAERQFTVSLPLVAIAQADAAGLKGLLSAQLTLPEAGAYAYTQHPNPRLNGPTRNLVIVRRN